MSTSAVSRSADSSIARGQLEAVGRGQAQVGVAEAGGGHLDRRERAAQVVPHRRQQRAARLGGLRTAPRTPRPAPPRAGCATPAAPGRRPPPAGAGRPRPTCRRSRPGAGRPPRPRRRRRPPASGSRAGPTRRRSATRRTPARAAPPRRARTTRAPSPTAGAAGRSRVSTVRANEASSAASARARSACCARRAARSTTSATSTPTTTIAPSVTTFSGSAIVNEYSGGVRKKLSSSPPSSAARNAGPSPPTSAATTVARKYRTTSVDSRRPGHPGRSPRPAARRPAPSRAPCASVESDPCSAGSRRPRPASSWVTMCTSMVAGVRRRPGCRRPRRTSARAGSAARCRARAGWRWRRGRSRAARSGTSSPPTTVWKLAPTSSARRRSFGMAAAGAPTRPSPRSTWTASRSAAPERLAIRAARRSTRLALLVAGQRDDHPLTGLPGLAARSARCGSAAGDVDLVGHPQQRQLAQRGEVARLEVVRQRGVDLLGGVDVAVREPAPQRLGGDVDQLDLFGAADDLVGHGLLLPHAGDPLDDVVERLQVLDVHGGDHVDARVEQLLDVLPALRVPRAGRVGVGELVDERDLGLAGEHRVEVHLVEAAPRWRRRGAGRPRDRRAARPSRPGRASRRGRPRRRCRGRGGGAPRRAWRRSCRRPAPCRGRCAARRVGHARSSPRPIVLSASQPRVEREVQLGDVDRGLAEEAEDPARRWPASTSAWTRSTGSPVTRGDPGDLQRRVGGADVRVEARGRGRHRVGGHGGRRRRPRGAAICWPPLVDRVEQLAC